MKEFMVWTSLA